MKLIEALRTGALGVEVDVPAGQTEMESAPQHYGYTDAADVRWLYLYRPFTLDLSPRFDDLLKADIEATARHLFQQMEHAYADREELKQLNEQLVELAAHTPGGARGSRLADPTWSPVVERARVTWGGATGLRTIHRMTYRPGRENVMGHLTVPLARGTLEVRVIAADSQTGTRESVLFDRLPVRFDEATGAPRVPPASYFDDPAHDAMFPTHCLSRVRAALVWAQEHVRVTRPPAAAWTETTEMPKLGATFATPPRFTRTRDDGADFVTFERASFALTDGLWTLLVLRFAAPGLDDSTLRQHVERALTELKQSNSSPTEGAATRWDDGVTRLRLVYLEGRTEAVWWRNRPDELVGLMLSAPPSAAGDEAWATLAPVVASWRLKSSAPKPWWRVW